MSSSCSKKIKGCNLQAKVDGQLLEYNNAFCSNSGFIFSMIANDGSMIAMTFTIPNLDGAGTYKQNSVNTLVSMLLTLDDGSQVIPNNLTVEMSRYESNGMEGSFSGSGVNAVMGKAFEIT